MTIPSDRLLDWTTRLLVEWGFAPDDAAYVAAGLVDANLRGVDSHGVIRLPAYRARIDAGLVSPTAVPVVEQRGAVVRIDAAGAQGQLAARAAVEAVDAAATAHGVGTVVVRGSAHFGTAGTYARALAARGKVAMVVSNSEPGVVPFGGREPLLGTNPFAFAAPTSGEPVSLDMATSTSAMGKVFVARAAGTSIPDTWGVDAEGRPTTDPHAVVALLPAGGPKGYGIGFLVEILGGVLSGAAIASGIGSMYDDFSKPQDVGHWMLALDAEAFMPLGELQERMDALVAEAHAIAPAPGSDEVLVPGEPEERTRRTRLADGIALPDATVDDLVALGERFAVPFEGGAR
ncbi:Ldh family oxidoreductase [Agrococcus sp. SGAir0287]|uniref:Ldh family oxidoreductase n=1 Tax=Agrococcus sp. SGAir0287 TaxID=2070347 RepID=UPI0015867BDF|nr:Ldh family oxidoreductase [Agrococcus sp. SGAir0287]